MTRICRQLGQDSSANPFGPPPTQIDGPLVVCYSLTILYRKPPDYNTIVSCPCLSMFNAVQSQLSELQKVRTISSDNRDIKIGMLSPFIV